MFRKRTCHSIASVVTGPQFALVGLVLLVGRGTIAQLGAGIVLSFGFIALQIKTWPYKLEMDNLLRTATEMHVCIAIVLI